MPPMPPEWSGEVECRETRVVLIKRRLSSLLYFRFVFLAQELVGGPEWLQKAYERHGDLALTLSLFDTKRVAALRRANAGSQEVLTAHAIFAQEIFATSEEAIAQWMHRLHSCTSAASQNGEYVNRPLARVSSAFWPLALWPLGPLGKGGVGG